MACLALALVVAGCGLPREGSPRILSKDHVPFNLLSPVPPTTTSTTLPAAAYDPVKIFLLDPSNQLQSADRVVRPPAPLVAVLVELMAGPTVAESSQHLTTAISPQVKVHSAVVNGTVATVNFNQVFGQITGDSTELAVAQVVATVAQQVGIATGVIFEINGQRTEIPTASGAEVPGPVYLWQVIPQGTTVTTTTTTAATN
jgi:Sporulation and spore germination